MPVPARVEAAIQRFKQVFGDRLRAHGDEDRRTEIMVACNLLPGCSTWHARPMPAFREEPDEGAHSNDADLHAPR